MPRPKGLSQTPRPVDLDDPRADVLADLLGASLLRNAMYRRFDCGAPWGFRMTERERVTFYVVGRGTARFEVDGEPLHVLSVGDAIFLPHGTPHIVRDAPISVAELACTGTHGVAGDGHLRRFGGKGATSSLIGGFFAYAGQRPVLLASLPRALVSRADDPSRSATMTATLQLLIAEGMTARPASTFVLQRLAEVLLVHALRELATSSAGDPRKLAAIADPAIHHALEVIHHRLAQPWTVASLAKSVGMSRSAFAERFTALVGEPPLQYLARWRMARAGELLRESTTRINEIAASVGYASVPSFNKAFRKWQGATPTGFRAV
jgi:AraC-like DNA-binding protein/mannose-6-phosphate isomerase-like protein (cupin superfamily)